MIAIKSIEDLSHLSDDYFKRLQLSSPIHRLIHEGKFGIYTLGIAINATFNIYGSKYVFGLLGILIKIDHLLKR